MEPGLDTFRPITFSGPLDLYPGSNPHFEFDMPIENWCAGEKRDGGPAGLGFGDTGGGGGNPGDVFSLYRNKRSSSYHDSLARVTTGVKPQPIS